MTIVDTDLIYVHKPKAVQILSMVLMEKQVAKVGLFCAHYQYLVYARVRVQ